MFKNLFFGVLTTAGLALATGEAKAQYVVASPGVYANYPIAPTYGPYYYPPARSYYYSPNPALYYPPPYYYRPAPVYYGPRVGISYITPRFGVRVGF